MLTINKKCLSLNVNRLECTNASSRYGSSRVMSDEELLRLCLASQDETLWGEFVRRFQPVIAGVIFTHLSRCPRCIDRTDVDGLVGYVSLKLCRQGVNALHSF